MVGQLLERLEAPITAAVLAATPGHAGALDDVAGVVATVLAPTVVVGLVVPEIAAGGEVAPAPALACLGLDLPGPVALAGAVPPPFRAVGALHLAGAEPHGPPSWLGAPAVGAAGARGGVLAGGRLGGAAATVVFGPGSGFEPVLVAGDRAVGAPLTVTRAEGRMLLELDGLPAHDLLRLTVAERLASGDRRLAARGLRLRPDDGHSVAVVGVDRSNGALALSGPVGDGATVSFAVHDPLVACDEVVEAAHGATATLAASATAGGPVAAPDRVGPFLPLLWLSAPDVVGPGVRRFGAATVAAVFRPVQ
ncbi:MAG TPA: FIST N-terminal domain-containing protein [Acidimicrobiales bacterium]|nr:FIST N-terminal domain-containing protein [Acidimicrobiales bacterium]